MNLLTTKPIKRYSDFYKKDIYVIPCRVVELGDIYENNKVRITIERIHFTNGKAVYQNAITYKKSLAYFSGYGLPFITECCLVKRFGKLEYIVYGKFNTGAFVDKLMGTYQNYTKDEQFSVYKKNYEELNEWLSQK